MVGWIVQILLIIAGVITSFFIARDALNFEIIQMVVAVLLFTIIVFIIAFWSNIKKFFRRK